MLGSECYLLTGFKRNFNRGYSHDIAPKSEFRTTFDRVYNASNGAALSPAVNPQEIALIFIVLAQGTMYNIEMPHYDPSAEEWLHLSEQALVKGMFLSRNMVAGVQTLVSLKVNTFIPLLIITSI